MLFRISIDYTLANPPFNVKDWSGELLGTILRWKYGVPPRRNANLAWVQHIIHYLTPNGIAGIVLANGSMSSNTDTEGDIRKALIENNLVDCIVALPGSFSFGTQIPRACGFLLKTVRMVNQEV